MPTDSTEAVQGSSMPATALYDRAPFPIFLIDAETRRILDANPAACALYGYSPEEMRQRTNADMSAEPNRTSAAVDRRLGKVPVRFHRKRDGTVFPVEISATYFTEGEREIHVAFIHDISDRVSLETREKDLWKQVQHLGRLTDLGTLASRLAHDLAQPLTAIMNYASALGMMAESGRLDIMRLSQATQRIRDQAASADGIIKGIRNMIARDSGNPVAFDLGEVVVQVADLFEGQATERAVRIDVAPCEGLPPVLGYPVQIRQVLVNLVQNALDVLTQSEHAPRVINITAETVDEAIRVTVRDSGPGIAAEVRDTLFDPFVTTKKEGMGIGLNIARKIVESHGGRIDVESPPGEGAAFVLTIPVDDTI